MNNYLPSNEAARLETLRQYQFLHLDTEKNFDEITKLVAYICGTPVALVSIVERDRQWFKSKIGWKAKETPREIAFCSQTILQKDLLIVEDTLTDQRFANNPLVILDPKIRFYAGAPLINVDGFAVGTLCVIDYVPRCLSSEQLTALKVLSRQVMMQLELDRYSSQSLRNQTERQYAELALKNTYDELNQRNAELGKTKRELHNAIAQLQVAQEKLHQQQELSVSDEAIEAEHQRYQNLFNFAPDGYLIAERYHLIAQATNDAVWDWNLLTDHIWWNEDFYTLCGYSASQVRAEANWWYENIHPEDREKVISGIHTLIKSSESFWNETYRFLKADGTYAYILDRGYILRDEQGTGVRMIGGIMDVTEKKLTEEKIREQAALLNITTDAIRVQNLEHKILFWNKGSETVYGWAVDEAIGKDADQLLHQKTLPEFAEIHKILFQKGNWQGELHQVRKDGKEIVVSSRWTLMRDDRDQPKSILIVNNDITEKKQLEAQFLRTQRIESIGTLASGIAHDLNNVLAPILMAIPLLEKHLPNQQCQHILEIIKANAKRGADLVKQVLSFGRGVEGKRSLFQLRHLILEIKQVVNETFPKSMKFCMDIPIDIWNIYGDMTQLHQILMNLCVNARDAMPEGGTLSLSVENLLIDEQYCRMNIEAKVGRYIVITVADTGMGIPPEILDKIFEPFFTTKEYGKGTGLGLSTTIGIIKSHNGFLTVNSQLGKGTEFKVYLPAIDVSENQAIEDDLIPIGKGELVMVVDDEPAILEIIKASLEASDYRVLTANDGIDAVALYAQHKQDISVVLTNMMMPEMDGIATIRTLKKMNPQVKIIGLSGAEAQNQFNTMFDNNSPAFLLKPFTTKQLLKTLDGVLAK